MLLNREGCILGMNPAAREFFGLSEGYAEEYEGKDFLSIERDLKITAAREDAKSRGDEDISVSRNGREYRLGVSRVETDGSISGVVLLIVDETEKVFAERNRREFTANVSHELKTPLHSIIGSAEILENGLVKPEDVPRFVEHIRTEASRLEALTEDIIRLSQLDENVEMATEEVDVYETAAEAAELLGPAAEEKNVTVTVEGEHIKYECSRQLMHEIIYNLCDNAIKYNVDGGSVKILLEKPADGTAAGAAGGRLLKLTVTDTGIGIPPESLDRVFERFYRVDKSHSKKIGGTGLGLSIVKHAVQSMKGEVSISSVPDEGTKIEVVL